MKQYISVLSMAIRSSFAWMIGIFLAMAAAEIYLFNRVMQEIAVGKYDIYHYEGSLEEAVSMSHIPLVCMVAFLALCIILCLTGCEIRGGKMRYTIQRLRVSEKRVTALWGIYNVMCLLLFWAVQLITVLYLCRLYMEQMDSLYWTNRGVDAVLSNQTVFVAFYRSEFLHNLLPLQDYSRYVRNIALIAALGFSASIFSYRQRHDGKSVATVFLAIVTIYVFRYGMTAVGMDVVVALIALAVVLADAATGVWSSYEED